MWRIRVITVCIACGLMIGGAAAQETSTVVKTLEEAGVTPLSGNVFTFLESSALNLAGLSGGDFLLNVDRPPSSQGFLDAGGSLTLAPEGDFFAPTLWQAGGEYVNPLGERTAIAVDPGVTEDGGRFALVTTLEPGDYSETVLPPDEFPRGDGGAYGVFQVFSSDGTPVTPLRNAYRPDLFSHEGNRREDILVSGAVFLSNGNLAVLSENRRGGAGLGDAYEMLTNSVIVLSIFDGVSGDPVGHPIPVSPPTLVDAESTNGIVRAGETIMARYEQDGARLVFLNEQGQTSRSAVKIADLFPPSSDPIPFVPEEGGPGDTESIASNGRDTFYVTHHLRREDGVAGSGKHVSVVILGTDGVMRQVVRVDDGANDPADGEINSVERSAIAVAEDGRFFVCWDPGQPGAGVFTSHRPLIGRFFDPDAEPSTPSFIVYDGDSNQLDDFFGFLCRDAYCAFSGPNVTIFAQVDDLTSELPRARILAAPSVPVRAWAVY